MISLNGTTPTNVSALALQHPSWQMILARHGRSFWLASQFLPPRVRQETTVLYAFFRLLDDLVDTGMVAAEQARIMLLSWRDWLTSDFSSSPPPDPTLATAIASIYRYYRLPRIYALDLIDGLIGDLHPRRIENYEQLLHYCYSVGGTVGLTLAPLLGVCCARGAQAACTLGQAMQLTNIARDLGEDLRRNRLYIPRQDLRRFSVDEHDLFQLARNFAPAPPPVRQLVRLQSIRAKLLYQRARDGFACLPGDVRFGIIAAAELYSSILIAIERNGYDSIRTRAVAGADDKLLALLRAWRLQRQFRRGEMKPCPTCG